MAERRSQIRVPVNLPATLRSGADQFDARILNVSELGLFVMADQGLQHGEGIRGRLALRDSDEVCLCAGRVVWRTPLGAGVEISVRNEPFAEMVRRLVVVANSARAKKELLSSLVAPVYLEVLPVGAVASSALGE